MTKRMPPKWIYLVDKVRNYKELITNKRSCPVCRESRRIERVVTFVVCPGVGIMKPYHCKSCGASILVGTGELLDYVNERGRNYPIDTAIFPDIPLLKDAENHGSIQTAGKESE